MMINSAKPKESIKNKLQYYCYLFDSSITFFISFSPFFQISSLFSSMANENNFNLDPNERNAYESHLTTSFFYGLCLGTFLSSQTTSINTKYLMVGSKVALGAIYILSIFSSLNWMIFLRFITGVLSDLVSITFKWSSYEVSLPEHQETFMNSFYVVSSLSCIGHFTLSLFDTGSFWYWRIVFVSPCIVVVISLLLNVFVIRDINTITYLHSKGGSDAVETAFSKVFNDEAVQMKLDEFTRKIQAKESFMDVFSKNKRFFYHIVIVACGTWMGLNQMLESYGIFIISKDMKDEASVRRAKMISIGVSILFFVSTMALAAFKFNERRKITLTLASAASALFLFSIGLFYFMRMPVLAQFCLLPSGITNGVIFSTVSIYTNDILPSQLFFITFILNRIFTVLFGYIFQFYLRVEESDMGSLGIKLMVVAVLGLVGVYLMVHRVMIETMGKMRSQNQKELTANDESLLAE